MGALLQKINTHAEWIVKAFAADQSKLDYSIPSFMEIDKFLDKHAEYGQLIRYGQLSDNRADMLFSLGSYVGQTIINKVAGAVWLADDSNQQGEMNTSMQLPDGAIIFPMQQITKRIQHGYK